LKIICDCAIFNVKNQKSCFYFLYLNNEARKAKVPVIRYVLHVAVSAGETRRAPGSNPAHFVNQSINT
jgi:hypothetical protein